MTDNLTIAALATVVCAVAGIIAIAISLARDYERALDEFEATLNQDTPHHEHSSQDR